jgi:hypothetical protein
VLVLSMRREKPVGRTYIFVGGSAATSVRGLEGEGEGEGAVAVSTQQ